MILEMLKIINLLIKLKFMKKNKKDNLNLKELLFSNETSFKQEVPTFLEEIKNNNEYYCFL